MALLHFRILVRQGDHFLICRSEGDFHFVPFLDQFDSQIVVSFGPVLNDQGQLVSRLAEEVIRG